MSGNRTTSRIPGFGPGILFFAAALAASPAAAAPASLAAELAEEGDWRAVRIERLRENARNPGVPPSCDNRLLDASIFRKLGQTDRALATWQDLAGDPSVPVDVRCRAAIESGYAFHAAGDPAAAWTAFRFAFLHAADSKTFWEAGQALWLVAGEAPDAADAETLAQAALCRTSWPAAVRARTRARLRGSRPSLWRRAAEAPGRALIAFYRAQISPAIGARCALHPSCSAYFLRATRKHALLGIPMGADRLVREPDVTHAAARWVELPDGRFRIADPVEDHDAWWNRPDP